MAELGVSPPTDLYPKPPSQQGALSSNPNQMLDLIGNLMKNEQMRRELAGRAALGQAYQGAIQSDGTIDPNKAIAGLRGTPGAEFISPEQITQLINQQGTQFTNAATQNQWLLDRLGALAQKRNLSSEDIRHFVVDAARDARANPAMLEGFKSAILDGNPGSKELTRRAQIAQAQATGSANLAGRIASPPLPGGAPGQQSVAAGIYGGGGPQAVGQPPGEEELQKGAAEAAKVLEATGGTTTQYHADLQNLRQLNKNTPLAGPTAEWERRINQLGSRYGIKVTLTDDQLQNAEEFAKIANRISLQQSTLFHGSDAGLHTTIDANPSLAQSQAGREAIIDRLEGTQDAIDRTRKLWFDSKGRGATANSHFDFLNKVSQTIDPRVFQFNRMSRENQQKFLSDMDQGEIADFEAKYQHAINQQWVKPLKGQQPVAQQ